MVRASTVVVAALAIAPVLAVPLTEQTPQEDVLARSVEDSVADLEARFKLGKVLKSIAKKAVRTAVPGAALVIREADDETSLEARNNNNHHPAVQEDVVARSVEETVDDLEARFKLGKVLKSIAKKAVRTAVPGAALVIREAGDETSLEARNNNHHPGAHAHSAHTHHAHHHARDLDAVEEVEDLTLREPIKLGAIKVSETTRAVGRAKIEGVRRLYEIAQAKTLSRRSNVGRTRKRTRRGKGKKGRGRGRKRSSRPRPRSLDIFEDEPLEAREALDLESSLVDLIERGYLEIVEDVETREPKLRLKNIVKGISGVAGKVKQVAGKVVDVANVLGVRELEDGEFFERDFDVEEFEARAEKSLDELD